MDAAEDPEENILEDDVFELSGLALRSGLVEHLWAAWPCESWTAMWVGHDGGPPAWYYRTLAPGLGKPSRRTHRRGTARTTVGLR